MVRFRALVEMVTLQKVITEDIDEEEFLKLSRTKFRSELLFTLGHCNKVIGWVNSYHNPSEICVGDSSSVTSVSTIDFQYGTSGLAPKPVMTGFGLRERTCVEKEVKVANYCHNQKVQSDKSMKA
ncbi:hypothetical protein R1flu_005670 [Riccia fluitans]|uniref:Uncharacterized protein n=1 Tax=Riccia fluitans TaxID=41844 RepID=A0ABD1YUE4_9MARC